MKKRVNARQTDGQTDDGRLSRATAATVLIYLSQNIAVSTQKVVHPSFHMSVDDTQRVNYEILRNRNTPVFHPFAGASP